jgi:Na+-transporting NADH:ubiquinone oxidoreductase subunit C
MKRGPLYTFVFAAIVCAVCGVLVSAAAVLLKDAQARNRELDRDRKVLEVAGLTDGRALSDDEVAAVFAERVRPRVLRLETAEYVEARGVELEENVRSQDPFAPRSHAEVFEVVENGALVTAVLPVEGRGLWSTLRGFVAIDADGTTIRGLAFHDHGETPGLGGEIDNPRWKARWPGRKAFDDTGRFRIRVVKGAVGAPAEDPHRVDAISGATITSEGVGEMLSHWLGDAGYGPYLTKLREGAPRAQQGAR